MAQRHNSILIAASAGLVLVVAGALSLAASLTSLRADPVLEAIRSRNQVSQKAVVSAAHASLAASKLFQPCKHMTNAALAISALDSSDAHARLQAQFGAVVTAALRRCPASPHNWLRLAEVQLHNKQLAASRRSWRMAVLTGRYVPGLMAARLECGLRLIQGDDAEHLRLLAEQIRIMAQSEPYSLKLVAQRTNTSPFVRAVLTGDGIYLDRPVD